MAFILPFLLLGHVLGEFVFQSTELLRRKRRAETRAAALLSHAGILAVCHLLVALPVLSPRGAVVILLLVVAHAVIDVIKLAGEARSDRPLTWFLADQAAHLVTLLLATSAWGASPSRMIMFSDLWLQPDPGVLLALGRGALHLSAWILAWRAGGFIVVMVLDACRISVGTGETDPRGPRLGRVIGVVERLLIVILVLHEAWAGIGLILAAKSIARFKELEDRRFGEYYLVGTLTSVLAAVAVGLGISALLRAV